MQKHRSSTAWRPGAKAGKWFDLRLILIGLGGLAVIAAATLVQPKLPASARLLAVIVDDDADKASEPSKPVAEAPAAVLVTEAPAAPAIAQTWKVGKGSALGFTTSWAVSRSLAVLSVSLPILCLGPTP